MPEAVKVCVIGRDGRLGSAAVEWIRDDPELELVGAIGSHDPWSELKDAAVCLDVTRAGLGASHASRALELGVRPVVGTSGVSRQEVESLDELARSHRLGGAVVPNFSLGFLALCRAAKAASPAFSSPYIVEVHRAGKADAPSGSAIHLARELEAPLESVTSLRMSGVTAVHELHLCSTEERLLIRHESHGLRCFKAGVLSSLKFAADADGIAHGLGEGMAALEL